jgi:hypothetical protein
MDRRRALVCVVTNFHITQGLVIFIPAEYHWLHKDSLLWRHVGQSKLSSVPAQAVKIGYEYSAGRFRFRLRFRESPPVGAKYVPCLTVQVAAPAGRCRQSESDRLTECFPHSCSDSRNRSRNLNLPALYCSPLSTDVRLQRAKIPDAVLNAIFPPEDGHVNARNMSRIIM